jgi:hypothetical protein
MQRFHLALTTHNLESTISDYSVRLGIAPEVVVQGEYALWRTDSLNVSVRVDLSSKAGSLRHLGFEDSLVPCFSEEVDVNGLVWERFSATVQKEEIETMWPGSIIN